MKIVLDLDDVLTGFVEHWVIWLKENGYTDRVLSLSEVSTYDFFQQFGSTANDFYLKDPHFTYENLQKPYEGSHDFINWCETNFGDIMILSHASNERSKDAKKQFVKRHFGIDNIKFSNSVQEKYKFTDGCILVDDYPLNLLKHLAYNDQPAVCFNKNNSYGWAKLSNHPDLIKELNPDFTKYWHSDSYQTTKSILERFI